jgi:hypothetical protein
MTAVAAVAAHQGGWDEILLVLAPVAVFAVLLYVANKRAGRLGDDEGRDDAAADPGDADAGHG